MTPSDEKRRKRIVFRSMHRGIREMDIVIGTYVREHIDAADSAQLDEMERILEIPDQDLLAWLTGARPVPEEQTSTMLEEILAIRFDETFFGNQK